MTSGGAPLGGDGALSPVTAPLSPVTSGRRPRRSGCAPQRNALVLWEFLRTPLLLPKTAGNEFNKSLRNLYLSSFWSTRWSDHLPKFGWMKTSIFTAIMMNLRNKSDIVTRNFVTCSLTWFTSASCVNSDLQYTLSSDTCGLCRHNVSLVTWVDPELTDVRTAATLSTCHRWRLRWPGLTCQAVRWVLLTCWPAVWWVAPPACRPDGCSLRHACSWAWRHLLPSAHRWRYSPAVKRGQRWQLGTQHGLGEAEVLFVDQCMTQWLILNIIVLVTTSTEPGRAFDIPCQNTRALDLLKNNRLLD